MRRFLIGAAIGFGTFLIGMVPSLYPFEGFFVIHGNGLSDCTVDFGGRHIATRPSGSSEFTDTLAVYKAVIEDEAIRGHYLVLADQSDAPVRFSGVDTPGGPVASGLETETWAYETANRSPIDLKYFVNDGPTIHFFNTVDNKSLVYWGKRDWISFNKDFPNSRGLTSFSAIGFNADRTRAIVNVQTRCGVRSGDDKFDFLIKVNGRWMVRTKYISGTKSAG